MITEEQKEKKGPRITELAAFVSVMISIIIAGTSLFGNIEKVPLWWFHFSFIILIALTFVIPSVIFSEPISERVRGFGLKRKRNAVSRKHFSEFRNLVYVSKRFSSSIRMTEDGLRNHYRDSIKSSLAMYVLQNNVESEIRQAFFEIEERLKESNKSFRDLSLIMRHFEFCLDTYVRHLKIIEVCVHGIISRTGKPIAKGIEAEFEAFREKFNDFVKDFQDYCHKVNEELGERKFPEWAIHRIRKW